MHFKKKNNFNENKSFLPIFRFFLLYVCFSWDRLVLCTVCPMKLNNQIYSDFSTQSKSSILITEFRLNTFGHNRRLGAISYRCDSAFDSDSVVFKFIVYSMLILHNNEKLNKKYALTKAKFSEIPPKYFEMIQFTM